jgi:uncharacterized RDD family membrane protein YckC
MQWYYADNGKQVGPLSETDFQALVKAGTITPQTLVWKVGMAAWSAYGTLAADTTAVRAPVTQVPGSQAGGGECCECGRRFPLDEMLQYENSLVCAGCKPVFFQRVQEGAALPGTMRYAGFWIRFAAKFIDGIVIGAVNMLISLGFTFLAMRSISGGSAGMGLGLQVLAWFVQMFVQGSYTVYFLGKFGATPGKMACKIKVVRADGSPISTGRALGRFFGEMLSGLILGIGYLMVAFDDEKRALHDRLCDTRVIYKD